MGIQLESCKKCGAMSYLENGLCAKCREDQAPSIEALSNGIYKASKDANAAPYPEIWMYVLSVFFPILQYILMGVYVSKGDTSTAWSLWWKPAIGQAIIYVIAGIILASM
ncbi:MAG: hypothetical protein Q4A05_06450 [Ruminococcus sp.]|nr:hypothetical protein [Ruminococcus sp.]